MSGEESKFSKAGEPRSWKQKFLARSAGVVLLSSIVTIIGIVVGKLPKDGSVQSQVLGLPQPASPTVPDPNETQSGPQSEADRVKSDRMVQEALRAFEDK